MANSMITLPLAFQIAAEKPALTNVNVSLFSVGTVGDNLAWASFIPGSFSSIASDLTTFTK